MPHSPHGQRRRTRGFVMGGGLGVLVLALLHASGLEAQELTIERELPPPPTYEPCPDVGEEDAIVSEENRSSAEVLAQEAVQARILGERERARSLLAGAAALDPTSSSIQFQLGRVLDELDEEYVALQAFCRSLDLAPEGPNGAEAEQAIARLAPMPEDSIPDAARAAFHEGVELYDAGEYGGAAREFSRALVETPDWALAHFNRALTYIREGRVSAGRADLERYLELRPGEGDTAVRARLETLDASPSPRPGIALATGLIIPGMGHVYSGRPGVGTVYLLGAGAGIAAALLYKQVEIVCSLGGARDQCPPEYVAEERQSRPLLAAGLAGAGAITLIGAIHAYRSARGQRADATPGMALELPLPGLGSDDPGPSLALDPLLDGGTPGLRAAVRVRF